MKIYKILGVLLLSVFAFMACDKNELAVTGVEGGLIEIKNPSINYIVGNSGPYSSTIRVYQGTVKTNKVEIFKTFHTQVFDPKDSIMVALSSNKVLYKTINIDNVDQNSMQTFQFSFNELIDGLKIKDANLATADGDYRIGDFWEFQYYTTTSDGRTLLQDLSTKVTVATRYAGKYKCIEGQYFRLGVLTYVTSDWPDVTEIQSVDAKTYRVLNYWGAFDGNEWYFQIENGVISYPAEWDRVAQTINGQPMITCITNASDMTEVCGLPGANTVVNDDVNGKDKLIMSNGYYTTGSGPRIGYQVMEKIVE
jgi:hypothetical protein